MLVWLEEWVQLLNFTRQDKKSVLVVYIYPYFYVYYFIFLLSSPKYREEKNIIVG